jgi:hypothetical protein
VQPKPRQQTILTRDKPLIDASDTVPDRIESIMVFNTDQMWPMVYGEGLGHQQLVRARSPDLILPNADRADLPCQKWMAHRYAASYV